MHALTLCQQENKSFLKKLLSCTSFEIRQDELFLFCIISEAKLGQMRTYKQNTPGNPRQHKKFRPQLQPDAKEQKHSLPSVLTETQKTGTTTNPVFPSASEYLIVHSGQLKQSCTSTQFLIFSEQWIILKWCVIFQPCLHSSCYNCAEEEPESPIKSPHLSCGMEPVPHKCYFFLLGNIKYWRHTKSLFSNDCAEELPYVILTHLRVASFWRNHRPAPDLISSRARVHPARYLQAINAWTQKGYCLVFLSWWNYKLNATDTSQIKPTSQQSTTITFTGTLQSAEA